MESPVIRDAFLKLKPCCDEFMKIPNEKTAVNVVECIKKLNDSSINYLFEYICYPIIIHLQNSEFK